METLNHPYINAHGSLDHAAASDGARDARSDALRAMFRALLGAWRTPTSRTIASERGLAHVA